MNICSNIKKYRLLKKITQKRMSEILNINIRTYQKYESGDINPNMNTLNKIAAALDVEITDLLAESIDNGKNNITIDLSNEDNLDKAFYKVRALSQDKEFMNDILSKKIEDVGYFEKLILSIYNSDRIKAFNIDVATEICNLLNSDVMQKELNYSFTDILNDEAYFALMISSIISTIENNLTFIKNSDKSKNEDKS
jgi:transcriptional regulator with XRE-family HTH domain